MIVHLQPHYVCMSGMGAHELDNQTSPATDATTLIRLATFIGNALEVQCQFAHFLPLALEYLLRKNLPVEVFVQPIEDIVAWSRNQCILRYKL